MVDLIAKSPCDGLLPKTMDGISLTEVEMTSITSVAPFKGREGALSEALKTAHGMAFPAPNRATGKEGARAVWFSRGQAVLIGPEPDVALGRFAALTDQSDAWSVVRLDGEGVEEVLARLVPIDLRPQSFKRGHTARTQLMHMTASITRVGERAFQIMVFRSMSATLVHDLETAMEGVAARG
ncbi:sarcosine oxidase subunit gamma [Aestuariivita sp.]|uniref:sarcosine oxidase subunit gamma n=1 Tax=Aestuariivita sp. TaxID=1872407 RepID=UPI002172D39B|nr:sarcosine oxidase subunit gamma [Aestuariivita sp.]MCE8009370.1 sarcosine oxidase subunit gamma [Aestuariivita sp.]